MQFPMRSMVAILFLTSLAAVTEAATLAELRVSDNKRFLVTGDGEPIYEDHPVSFNADKFGHSISSDVRRPLYWNLFTGAFGHTYGHHSVWQMWSPGKNPINNPLMPWFEAVDQSGAGQMQHGRRLMTSRPFLDRRSFVPPDKGEMLDWVLVLDDAAKNYPIPGTSM